MPVEPMNVTWLRSTTISSVPVSTASPSASRKGATVARSTSPHSVTTGGSASTSATTWNSTGTSHPDSAASIRWKLPRRDGPKREIGWSAAEDRGQHGAVAEDEHCPHHQAEQCGHDRDRGVEGPSL